jgi:hypothetical protein
MPAPTDHAKNNAQGSVLLTSACVPVCGPQPQTPKAHDIEPGETPKGTVAKGTVKNDTVTNGGVTSFTSTSTQRMRAMEYERSHRCTNKADSASSDARTTFETIHDNHSIARPL